MNCETPISSRYLVESLKVRLTLQQFDPLLTNIKIHLITHEIPGSDQRIVLMEAPQRNQLRWHPINANASCPALEGE